MVTLGAKDTATAKYMRNNKVFADAFNYLIYGGKQTIDPDSLVELDTREIELPYGGESGAEQPIQRTRDVIKSVTAMTDRKTAYLVLAVENQSNAHYAMAVKNMMYDALQYTRQVEAAIASHKESGDYRGASGDEFLSGFMKGDHLMPVVTLVMYFGPEKWDGPMSIHEMFEPQDPAVLSYVPDYRINLIAPEAIADEDFGRFVSSLQEVLSFIKYSRNADKLSELLEENEDFRHLGRDEIDVLNACTRADIAMSENQEVIDMCEAIQVLNQRAAEKAATQAATQTRIAMRIADIKNLMDAMGWTAEQAMDILKVPEEDRELVLSQL
ncbi:MAG: Rpn family recombination-promoting nuclease/putative transposase [Oscillospiraceae bacterium]|nr:Rpn family recombination-promoting nuclease/putative transposase [Oscillospiraceae bacterium]